MRFHPSLATASALVASLWFAAAPVGAQETTPPAAGPAPAPAPADPSATPLEPAPVEQVAPAPEAAPVEPAPVETAPASAPAAAEAPKAPEAPPAAAPERGWGWLSVGGWAALAVGALGVVIGAVTLANPSDFYAAARNPRLTPNSVFGFAALVAGASLAVAGGVLLYLDTAIF